MLRARVDLGDHLGATALVDRMIDHSHVIVINGPSYRDWEHQQDVGIVRTAAASMVAGARDRRAAARNPRNFPGCSSPREVMIAYAAIYTERHGFIVVDVFRLIQQVVARAQPGDQTSLVGHRAVSFACYRHMCRPMPLVHTDEIRHRPQRRFSRERFNGGPGRVGEGGARRH